MNTAIKQRVRAYLNVHFSTAISRFRLQIVRASSKYIPYTPSSAFTIFARNLKISLRKRAFKYAQRPAVIFSIGLTALFVVGLFATQTSLFTIHEAYALEVGVSEVEESIALTGTDIRVVIARIIRVALGLLGIIAVVIVLYGGFLWMTAGGEIDKVAKAKKTLINGAIGLAIILMAFAIAQFVLNSLLAATLGSSRAQLVGPGRIISNSGSLGRGIIDMHFPRTGAVDVARNTNMIITFKRPIQLSSMIEGYDDAGTPADLTDDAVKTNLNTGNVQIYIDGQGPDQALASDKVQVRFTPDRRTFVFDPIDLLGSPSENIRYRIDLPGDGLRLEGGAAAFTGAFSGGYRNWWFDIGTTIDLTPPQVTNYFPYPQERTVPPFPTPSYERNVLIQVDFDEAIDPTSVVLSGNIEVEASGQGVSPDERVVEGRWDPANAYRTYEFTTTDACGENSCGETIFCLPGSADIEVQVHAADLTPDTDDGAAATFPYTGVADAAGNSLNNQGNNAVAEGSPDDDVLFQFRTSSALDIFGPMITSITPYSLTGEVAPDVPITVRFNEVMSRRSLNTEGLVLLPDPDHELWYSLRSASLFGEGGEAAGPVGTSAELRHGLLLQQPIGEPQQGYVPVVTPGVRDVYQNCFVPSRGPGPDVDDGSICEGTPYCCNGVPTNQPFCGAVPGAPGVDID